MFAAGDQRMCTDVPLVQFGWTRRSVLIRTLLILGRISAFLSKPCKPPLSLQPIVWFRMATNTSLEY